VAASEQNVATIDQTAGISDENFADRTGEGNARVEIDIFYNLNARVQRAESEALK
jgi:hypothetical protein